uniref:Uncharacterized protein n=1 Tax=Alternaria alternata chrysovirus 1 TaxID=2066695 RepID=A0A7D4X289_9VIRU|nr:hypothetical protein [Alternaria alternata chrysovirus 1]
MVFWNKRQAAPGVMGSERMRVAELIRSATAVSTVPWWFLDTPLRTEALALCLLFDNMDTPAGCLFSYL